MSDLQSKQRIQLEAAQKLRGQIESLKPVKDVENRQEHLRPHIDAGVKAICENDGCSCFSDEQISVLCDLVTHIVVTVEPSLHSKPGIRRTVSKMSLVQKIGTIAAIVAMLLGAIEIIEKAVQIFPNADTQRSVGPSP